jgi:hypothetical protein
MSIRAWMRLVEAIMSPAAPPPVTETAAFQQWFAGSKVVDKAGKPLRCYHGTQSDFHTFSNEDAPGRGGLLAFFSVKPQFASSYASDERSPEVRAGAQVMPVYLRIVNPFDYRKDYHMAGSFYDETGGIQDRFESNRILMGLGWKIDNIDDVSTPLLTEKQFTRALRKGSWDALEAPDFVEYIHDAGYDGIVLMENRSLNFAIFEANQVKSAIGNRGTFDPESDHIGESAPARDTGWRAFHRISRLGRKHPEV